MTDVLPAAVTALQHQVVAARARATILRLGRHAKAAAAELDAAQQLQEQMEQLRAAGAGGQDRQVCQCEHADHLDAPVTRHPHLEAPAGGRRAAFVGPVCDGCANGHLAEYVLDQPSRPPTLSSPRGGLS